MPDASRSVLTYVDYAGNSRPVQSQYARKSKPGEIPIIDIAPFVNPGASAREKEIVVQQVYDACSRVGFLYVKGHQLSQVDMESLFVEGEKFFALPEVSSRWYLIKRAGIMWTLTGTLALVIALHFIQDAKMETYFKKSPAFRVRRV